MRTVGTIVRGIRTPIIQEGDNLKHHFDFPCV